MRSVHLYLFALISTFYCTSLFAQINLSVEIHGVSAELENNIRLLLSVEQQKNHPMLTAGRLQRLHAKATQEITDALQPYGYYKPTIQAELTQSEPAQWLAKYTVDSGPPIPIAEFNFIYNEELQQDPEFQLLLEKLPLKKGDTFNHIEYEDIKSLLAKFAAERGYLRAHFVKHVVEIDLNAYEAHVDLHYDSGPRYLFGEVLFEQKLLDEDLLRRYIPFEIGSPYLLSQLIDFQQALNDSDYFTSVEVSPGQVIDESIEIPINVELKPRKRHRYTLGLGYGTDTGARAKFGWDMPRFNSAGHRVSTEAKVSEIGYSLAAYYRIPVLNPRTDQLVYSTGVINEVTDTSESTIRKVGASLNRGRGQWRESIALDYQQEKFIVADDEGESKLLIPSISWSRTWGSDFIYTLDGVRFDIRFRGVSDKLLSDVNFFQFQGGLKGITSLGKNYRVIANGRFGSTITDNFHLLPSSVRFFAGGSQSVRGYAYQSLGPKDSNGAVIGGKHLMIGSIEIERRFSREWGAAFFYDAGNAIDDLSEKLERGAGIGLRWNSPIGPVRVDLATAVSQEDHPWRLHITIGPDL